MLLGARMDNLAAMQLVSNLLTVINMILMIHYLHCNDFKRAVITFKRF